MVHKVTKQKPQIVKKTDRHDSSGDKFEFNSKAARRDFRNRQAQIQAQTDDYDFDPSNDDAGELDFD